MPTRERYQNRIELLYGTLDMLVLRTLQWGPQHGHGIGQTIQAQSDDLLKVETGSLYPALHRLEKRGFVRADWRTSENKQRARYYRLTALAAVLVAVLALIGWARRRTGPPRILLATVAAVPAGSWLVQLVS